MSTLQNIDPDCEDCPHDGVETIVVPRTGDIGNFEVIDKDFAMTEKQRDYYKRARITFDKIFNTNQ